jgi:hypothetical protein
MTMIVIRITVFNGVQRPITQLRLESDLSGDCMACFVRGRIIPEREKAQDASVVQRL